MSLCSMQVIDLGARSQGFDGLAGRDEGKPNTEAPVDWDEQAPAPSLPLAQQSKM